VSQDVFEQFIGGAHGRAPFASLGLAVSGGGDSMALLHLAQGWLNAQQSQGALLEVSLHAVTVDHGLRAEAAAEAAMVAQVCAGLGVSHDILRWDWDGQGNLQDAARRARYRLMADWARARGVDAIALGHTRDDQAETFLMRLVRGSGVDGLAAMRSDWQAEGTRWLRPLLSATRADLRACLTTRGVTWVEDPSNDDPRFDRVKARRAMAALADLGLDAGRLADTAMHMTNAREVMELHAHQAARRLCAVKGGGVTLDLAGLTEEPMETQLRLFAHALMWVSGASYRPRLDALQEAMTLAAFGDRRTLHGCLIEGDLEQLEIHREYNAVRRMRAAPGEPWDGRWLLEGPDPDAQIRALGEAIGDCPDWRETGLSRRALMASPAAFRDDELLAAPLAGLENGWTLTPVHPGDHFFTSILSH
jgi:tRNA(Ile)-lysidine synthase